jgi:DNA topoisomerase IB
MKNISNELQQMVGNPRGHNDNKEHRAQKLINRWDELKQKMSSLIERGHGTSDKARCAYAVLTIMETGIRVGNEYSANGYVPTKTEFVLVDGKHAPVRKRNKETGKYELIKKYADIKDRYILIDKKFILTRDFDNKAVQTYGLTTLLVKHTYVNGKLCFAFIGKKNVEQLLCTSNPVLRRYYKSIVAGKKPGDAFLDISYSDIYEFVKHSVGHSFVPKDLRTAAVNLAFIKNLQAPQHQYEVQQITKKSEIKKAIARAVEKTADEIGHTPGVCKGAYISKSLWQSYHDELVGMLAQKSL